MSQAVLTAIRYDSNPMERNGTKMSVPGKLRNRGVCATGLVLMLAFAPISLCQTISDQENASASTEPQDEITVYGRKNIVKLRYSAYAAEEAFLAKFNVLNTKDEFDFKCEFVIRLGRRNREHACIPQFAKRIDAAMAGANISGDSFQSSSASKLLVRRGKRYEDLLLVEIITLLRQHPDLQEAHLAVIKTNEAYEAERENRRKRK